MAVAPLLDPIQNVLIYFFERLRQFPGELACRSLTVARAFAESSKHRTAVADIRTGIGVEGVLQLLLEPLSPPPPQEPIAWTPLQRALLDCWPQPRASSKRWEDLLAPVLAALEDEGILLLQFIYDLPLPKQPDTRLLIFVFQASARPHGTLWMQDDAALCLMVVVRTSHPAPQPPAVIQCTRESDNPAALKLPAWLRPSGPLVAVAALVWTEAEAYGLAHPTAVTSHALLLQRLK